MYHKNKFPDQNLIGKLLGIFYDPEVKPLYINIDYSNKEINIRYRHNDFIYLFGDCIKSEEVIQYPGEYIYEKKFDVDGLIVIVSTYIIQNELINKKLVKIWRG